MKSVMQHQFSQAPTVEAPRSKFDRSFGYKTMFDAGWLIPFYVDDVLPGDTFNLNTNGFARLNTPIVPYADNAYMDTHFFFVPYRLVWDNSRKFFGEQVNPADSIDYSFPVFTSYTPAAESLSDYLGVPVRALGIQHHSLYHRGYNLIWNEWFRDQNLQDSLTVDTDDGPDAIADYVLKKRGKRHDYFTSALPWPQKGDAVDLPIGSSAPVLGIGPTTGTSSVSPANVRESNQATRSYTDALQSNTDAIYLELDAATGGWPTIYADLTNATASTINDIREAFQVQKLLERDARGGTRYSELVRNHFGVNFYDVSYRPEYLGGGSSPINLTPVASTNAQSISGTTNIGDLGAYGTSAFGGHGFTKSFVEHGFVIGLVSVRADLTYSQGLPRPFSKSTRYDIYWPSLAFLGEQEILNKEIYYQATGADSDVFGYQERYAEYRYKPSMITGKMRTDYGGGLDIWHLSQDFSVLPTLGDTFIQEDPPFDRVIQTPSEPHFIFDSYTSLICARPMPVYSVPGMIDHF